MIRSQKMFMWLAVMLLLPTAAVIALNFLITLGILVIFTGITYRGNISSYLNSGIFIVHILIIMIVGLLETFAIRPNLVVYYYNCDYAIEWLRYNFHALVWI